MKCYKKDCSYEGETAFTVFGKRLGELCFTHHKKLEDSRDQPLSILIMLMEHMDEIPPVHEPGTKMVSKNDSEKSLIILQSIPWERRGAWETGYKVYLYHSDNVIDIRGDILNRNWKVDNG